MLKLMLDDYAQRHWSKLITVDPTTGCHVWAGATRNGHPYASFLGKQVNPRRVLYAVHHFTPTTPLTLKPACGNALCVNPAHCGDRAVSQIPNEQIQAAMKKAQERMFALFDTHGTDVNVIIGLNPMLDREQVETYLKEYQHVS